jgi:hypothetical protein
VLRRIFGSKKEEVAKGWKRRHNDEHHKVHASPNIIRVIKSRRIGWAGHVGRMTEMRNTIFWMEIWFRTGMNGGVS